MASFLWTMCSNICVRTSDYTWWILFPLTFIGFSIVSISAAISIPFVLIAFNQDTIAKWLRALGKVGVGWTMIVILMAVLLALVWTSHLASGIKVAVTATIVLLSVLGILGQGIRALATAARSRSSMSTMSSGSRSLVDD